MSHWVFTRGWIQGDKTRQRYFGPKCSSHYCVTESLSEDNEASLIDLIFLSSCFDHLSLTCLSDLYHSQQSLLIWLEVSSDRPAGEHLISLSVSSCLPHKQNGGIYGEDKHKRRCFCSWIIHDVAHFLKPQLSWFDTPLLHLLTQSLNYNRHWIVTWRTSVIAELSAVRLSGSTNGFGYGDMWEKRSNYFLVCVTVTWPAIGREHQN